MKGFSEFIRENEGNLDQLPLLHELDEGSGEIIRWIKDNLEVDSESEIVEHTKGGMLYDILLKKHKGYTKDMVPWSRLSFKEARLDWYNRRRYAVLTNRQHEPLCFWIAKRDEYLFYGDNEVINTLFHDF